MNIEGPVEKNIKSIWYREDFDNRKDFQLNKRQGRGDEE
jgi:hypothetical protein